MYEVVLKRIKSKLRILKFTDLFRTRFGAKYHKYRLNSKITIEDVERFEQKHDIVLPSGYREFLINVGDGGAGPYYGLNSLADSIYKDLNYKREGDLMNPGRPFQLSDSWNSAEDSEDRDEDYMDDKWIQGLLRISHAGCAIYINLVVNGDEYGSLWIDDRASDGGIYPLRGINDESRVDFLTWYERWLNATN